METYSQDMICESKPECKSSGNAVCFSFIYLFVNENIRVGRQYHGVCSGYTTTRLQMLVKICASCITLQIKEHN